MTESVLTPTHLLSIKRELFRICEKQLKEVTRLQKSLRQKVDVSDLYNPLLDIWKELK